MADHAWGHVFPDRISAGRWPEPPGGLLEWEDSWRSFKASHGILKNPLVFWDSRQLSLRRALSPMRARVPHFVLLTTGNHAGHGGKGELTYEYF